MSHLKSFQIGHTADALISGSANASGACHVTRHQAERVAVSMRAAQDASRGGGLGGARPTKLQYEARNLSTRLGGVSGGLGVNFFKS